MSIQVNNKNLGHATAYAYAVAGGYTGTEAEFIELLGNIADDLEQIENLTVTVETLAAGSSATASYSNGVLHLGIPKGDKGDKGDTGATGPTGPTGNGIASVAKTGTSGLVDTYTITYTNGNTSTFTVTNGAEAVDNTLTIAGRAADAKKTGDEISELKEDLIATNAEVTDIRVGANGVTYNSAGDAVRGQYSDLNNDLNNLTNCLLTNIYTEYSNRYKYGSYNLSTGAYSDPYPTTSYPYVVDVQEKTFKLISNEVTINIKSGYKYRGVILKPDGTYHGYFSEWISTTGKPSALQNLKGYYIKPTIGKSDGSNISSAELALLEKSLFSISATYSLADEVKENTNAINEISELKSINILNPDDFKRNGYYLNFTDGVTHVSNDYYKMTADKIHTGLIEKLYVKQTYSTTSINTFVVYCYAGDTYLGYVSNNFAYYGSDFAVDVKDGTTDIRIMSNNSDGILTGEMLCLSLSELDEFVAYNPIRKIKEVALPSTHSHILDGKKVVFLGDSIFGNNQSISGVANVFADITGAKVTNFAFGGTQATLHAGSTPYALGWQKFDGISIANAIASGDFTDQESALSGGAMSEPAYFATSLANLEAYDFSKCDYIIADWGTNDWTSGASIADYKTALQTIVQTILTAYPKIIFIEVTPFIRFFESGGMFYNSSVYDFRNDGIYLNDFADAVNVLKEQPYNLQVIDCYNIGINDYTRTGFFSNNDWTHHDARGRKRIATFLSNNIC